MVTAALERAQALAPEDGRIVDLTARTTATGGRELGVLEQLFGNLLSERGPDVLAHLDLARGDGDKTVLGDVDPCRQVVRRLPARGRATRLLSERRGDAQADEDAASDDLEEISAIDVEVMERARDLVLEKLGPRVVAGAFAHPAAPLRIACAALRTAERMRG